MHTFGSIESDWYTVYSSIIQSIKEAGKLSGKFKCIYNCLIVAKPSTSLILPKKNWKWAYLELFDRLNSNYSNPGTSYNYRPRWKKKLEKEGGTFDYDYNTRLLNQLFYIKRSITNNKINHEAVATVYNQSDLTARKDVNRVPCTLTLQFYRTDDKLSLHINMRTLDGVNLLPFDFFHHSFLLIYMSALCGLEVGNFSMDSSVVYYQKKREERGWVDNFLSLKPLSYAVIEKINNEDFNDIIYLLQINHPLESKKTYGDFEYDFFHICRNLLYNEPLIKSKLRMDFNVDSFFRSYT